MLLNRLSIIFIVTVASLFLKGLSQEATAQSHATSAFSEVTGAILEGRGYDPNTGEALPEEVYEGSGNSEEVTAQTYNSQECVAEYGAEACVAFEECVATYGFDACYAYVQEAYGVR